MSILRLASLWFILVAELLEEATLSGRLCERKDDGTAWKSMAAEGWYDGTLNDWAGEPQITGVPQVHRSFERDGRGTTGTTSAIVRAGLATMEFAR